MKAHPKLKATFTASVFAALLCSPGLTQTVPSAPDEDVVLLNTFTVNASSDRGYQATNSVSGSRLNEPIKNVPMSITVITPELMRDMDPDTYDAALVFSAAYNPENQRIRGLTAFVNNRNSAGIDGELDTTGIDRVEVVKGPATLMYGVTAAGGQVNAISKRAILTKDAYRFDVQLGSQNRQRFRTDLNQVIIPGKLATRLSLKKESYDSTVFSNGLNLRIPLQTSKRKAEFAQWTTTYAPFKKTAITFEVEASRPVAVNATTTGLTLDANTTGQPNSNIPFAVLYGAPVGWEMYHGANVVKNRDTITRLDWEQEWISGLNTIVSVNNQFRPRSRDNPLESTTNFDVDKDGNIDRARKVTWRIEDYTIRARTYEAMATYKVETGPMTNGFLLRWQRREYDDRSINIRAATTSDSYAKLSGVTDWSNNYIVKPAGLVYDQVFKNSSVWDNTSDLRQYSASYMPVFKTDQGIVRVTYGVVRSEQVKTDGRPFTDEEWLKADPAPVSAIQPRGGQVKVLNRDLQEGTTTLAGVSYAPNDNYTFYSVITGSFRPVSNRNSFGEILAPRRGSTTEAGVKFDHLVGDRVSGTISYYNTIELNNVRTDPNVPRNTSIAKEDGLALYTYDAAKNLWTQRPGTTFDPNGPKGDSVSVGRYGAEGWDTEIFLRVANRMQAVISYNYVSAGTIADPDPFQIGRIDAGTAKHTVGLFGKYWFSNGPFKGLQLTSGVRWTSKKADQYQVINGGNVYYEKDGDFAIAVGARYERKLNRRTTVFCQLNVDNIWGQDAITGNRSNSTSRYKFDTPVTWKLMSGVSF